MKQFKLDKKYKFNMDMKQEFLDAHKCNIEVLADLAQFDYMITISCIEDNIVRYGGEYIVYTTDIKYFDLVDDTTEESSMTDTNNIRPNVDIVVEFLEKLQYIVDNDSTVGYGLMLNSDDVIMLSTDFGDITGASSVHNFITNRYDLLQQEAKHKKNNELMERKAKLEAELAEVVALLEGIK